ncbi:17235_t:CDS:2, partial [Racocetra fulgida]
TYGENEPIDIEDINNLKNTNNIDIEIENINETINLDNEDADDTNNIETMEGVEIEATNIATNNNRLIRRSPVWDYFDEENEQCLKATFDLIISAQLPFSFVENPWFRNAVNIYDSRYQLPSSKYIKKMTLSQFELCRTLVAEELKALT